jgi:hypothetical protein
MPHTLRHKSIVIFNNWSSRVTQVPCPKDVQKLRIGLNECFQFCLSSRKFVRLASSKAVLRTRYTCQAPISMPPQSLPRSLGPSAILLQSASESGPALTRPQHACLPITCGQRTTQRKMMTWSACACDRQTCHCRHHHRCCLRKTRRRMQMPQSLRPRLTRMQQSQTVSLRSPQGTTQAATWRRPPPETRGKAAVQRVTQLRCDTLFGGIIRNPGTGDLLPAVVRQSFGHGCHACQARD